MVTLRRPNIPTASQRQQFEAWHAYLTLWESGRSIQAIADLMGTTRQAVAFRLQKALRARAKHWI